MSIKYFDTDTGEEIPQLNAEEKQIFEALDTSKFSFKLESGDYLIYKYKFNKTKDGFYAISAMRQMQPEHPKMDYCLAK